MLLCDSPSVAEKCLESRVEAQSLRLEASVEVVAQPLCHSHEEA